MTNGLGMIWPLAAAYARRGWAVRRAEWDDLELYSDTGRALRWVIYQNALFWLVWKEPVTGNRLMRVIRNTDFAVDEFYAEDWTVFTPECLLSQSGAGQGFWQGFKPYARNAGAVIPIDPTNPNAAFGSCPIVPAYSNIKQPTREIVP